MTNMTNMNKAVAPISAARLQEFKKAWNTQSNTLKNYKDVDERADYVWREMARMAKVNIDWWEYDPEQTNVLCSIFVECSYNLENISDLGEVEQAMRWIFEDLCFNIDYLVMPDAEWQDDFTKKAKVLAAEHKEYQAEQEAQRQKSEKQMADMRQSVLLKAKNASTIQEWKASMTKEEWKAMELWFIGPPPA